MYDAMKAWDIYIYIYTYVEEYGISSSNSHDTWPTLGILMFFVQYRQDDKPENTSISWLGHEIPVNSLEKAFQKTPSKKHPINPQEIPP